MKNCLCIAVLGILCLHGTAAQETVGLDLDNFATPSFNPVMSSYFVETMTKSLSTYFDYMDLNFDYRTFKAQYDGQSDMTAFQLNTTTAFKVWLTKQNSGALFKVAIPVYFGAVSIFNESLPETSDWFLGSGLHIITDYVSLYGFVAYGQGNHYDLNRYNIAYKETQDAWKASGHTDEPEYPALKDCLEKSDTVLWSVMPEINMKKLPLLGIVFSLLKGSLTMDSNSDGFSPSYHANLLFRNINIGQGVASLAAVTGSDWYNSDAKYTVYGARFGVFWGNQWRLKPTLVIEGGYRSFFDVVAANPSYYENGPYGMLVLGVSMDIYYKDIPATLGLMCESSPQYWPLPRIGMLVSFSKPKTKIYIGSINDDRVSGARIASNAYDFFYSGFTDGWIFGKR